MRRFAGSRLGATSTLSVVLALGITAGTAAAVPPAAQPTATTATSAPSEVELPRPVRGANAVRLLADRLDEAAARNEMSATELTELLTTDPTAWIDTAGAVFYKEGVATAPTDDPVSARAPLSETFALHSRPGSTKTIFLDFDGAAASATGWHASYPATPTSQPAWDTGGNAAVFDDAERTAIQSIWQAVAEDYAPFDVDVTTADPGPDGINRSSLLDTTYGSHALITPSVGAHDAICNPLNNGSACGGVAYINVFDKVLSGGGDGYGYRQPAWVFPQKLGNSAKNIAEAVSHEVGHNFGLQHDGNATQGYDRGHGAWAPIMGVGYDRPISQWSKGDYAGATNQQDDVAIIRGIVGSRADEAPSLVLGAPSVPAGTAYVDSRTDVDTYVLGTCSGSVSVVANPLASLSDLDVQLTLLDGLGQVVATDAPTSAQTSTSTASGMGASLTRTLSTGIYYAQVDGVGNGPWSTGYDDYGSLGAYTLAATGCDNPTPTTTSLVATAIGRTVTLTATPSTLLGILTGEVVFREGTTVVGTTVLGIGSPVAVLTSVSPGAHTYTATFVPLGATHLGSASPATSVTVRTTSTTALTTSVTGRDVTLDAQVATDGGAPVGTVEVRDGDTLVGTAALAAGTASLTLPSVAPGAHSYRATFVPSDTAAYAGSTSSTKAVTIARVATTTDLTTSATGRTVTLAAAVATGSGVPAGVVELRDGTILLGTVPLSAGAASLTVSDVALGNHTYTATYVPSGTFHAGSTSPARTQQVVDAPVVPPTVQMPAPTPTADPLPTLPTVPPVSASTTTIRAPKKAKAGTRPRVTITVVRGASAASGTVVVTVGKRSRTLTLKAGSVRMRLARLKVGKVRITVRYAGDATTTASTAKQTIRVRT
ncbi:Ig-like domain repeat protein [Nocardioides zhouii]|uniref:Bacterial Ig-like domain-containing protein n=1 Tax=Nocardioides zhouii TaxID=1168729 RepID=A0A4Q2SU93_9ACTN|nr:Ig-like domain repeat protein [Nocardioides zhouii]RYC09576.1 hypothetical protein EUA94_13555 [Nocardioides zhouii]